MDDLDRMRELKQQGFFCSQILMMLGLELQGKENPDLDASHERPGRWSGFHGRNVRCIDGRRVFTGALCRQRPPAEEDDPRLIFMIEDLVKWFKAGYGQEYGGLRCETILSGVPNGQATRCPMMVAGTFQKVKELLVENGFDLAGIRLRRLTYGQVLSTTEAFARNAWRVLSRARVDWRGCLPPQDLRRAWRVSNDRLARPASICRLGQPQIPAHPQHPFTPIERGCPFDCGLCADHRQNTCSVLLEVTQRCDLRCPFCFASAGDHAAPILISPRSNTGIAVCWTQVDRTTFNYRAASRRCAMILPTSFVWGDRGFTFFQLNTNGLRLARDGDYLQH